MEIGEGLSQKTRASRAMARCILTGTASVVATYLVWRVVQSISSEVPPMFLITCIFVGSIALLSTLAAIYKISKHKPLVKFAVQEMPMAKKSKKVESYSSNLFLAVSVDKSEGAWYQRN